MDLQIRKSSNGAYIIDITGEMDLYSAFKLTELVDKMIEKRISQFVVNLENVEYIDSSGVGTLIRIYSLMKKKGLKFFLANIHGSAKKVIELTKLNEYFPIVASVDDALARMQQ